jgi:hypothetical protein
MLKTQTKNPYLSNELSRERVSGGVRGTDALQEFLLQRGRTRFPLRLPRGQKLALVLSYFSLFLGILGLTAVAVFWLTGNGHGLPEVIALLAGFFLVLFYYFT